MYVIQTYKHDVEHIEAKKYETVKSVQDITASHGYIIGLQHLARYGKKTNATYTCGFTNHIHELLTAGYTDKVVPHGAKGHWRTPIMPIGH